MAEWDEITRDVLDRSQDVFATSQPVVLRPGENGEEALRSIFRSAHLQLDPASGTSVSSSEPVLLIALSDVAGDPIEQGTRIRVGDILYRVRVVEPDGEGGARLTLKRTAA